MDELAIQVAVMRADMFICAYGPDIIALVIVCVVIMIVCAHERQ